MSRTNRIASFLLPVLLPLLPCCGGGGGGSPAPVSPVPANVPDGSGQQTIQMQGTWQLGGVNVVDGNTAALIPPTDGTAFVIGPAGLVSLGGLSVARADLEALLGLPLDAYVNELNGRTLFYGIVVDARAAGATREQGAIAGGSLDANTIAVEGFLSSQAANSADVSFVRWRGTLARVSAATLPPPPLDAAAGGEDRPRLTVRDVLGGR